MARALYRKWRPMTFSDVVGQPQVTETLKKQIAGGRLSHAYLFTGTRGTGKTTCAKILAKAANCLNPHDGEPCNECAACRAINEGSAVDVSEIDAASNSGVDNIRAIRDQAAYVPVELKYRVYIIDECHMLSAGAWNALLKTLEEPPEHVLFILATTELNKIPPTILSRCQRYAFRRGTVRDLALRVREIAAAENITLTEDGAAAIARLADGAFRDAVSMLDQCASARPDAALDEDAIFDELGLAGSQDTLEAAAAVAEGDAARALGILASLYDAGKDMAAFLGELASVLRDALILVTTKSPALLSGRYPAKSLDALGLPAGTLSAMLEDISDAQARSARSSSARLEAELCLVRLATRAAGAFAPSDDAPATQTARGRAVRASAAPAAPAGTASAPTPAPAQSEQKNTPAPPPPTGGADDTPPWEAPAAPAVSETPAKAAPPASGDAWEDVPPPDDSFAPGAPDMGEAPPWDGEPTPPPRRAAVPAAVGSHRAAAPAAAKPARPSGETAAGWWQDTLIAVRPKIPISNYMQLAAQPPAVLEGDTVTIYVTSSFAKHIAGDAKVLAAVGQEASRILGRQVGARCLLESERSERDAMDELLKLQTKFDNFKVE